MTTVSAAGVRPHVLSSALAVLKRLCPQGGTVADLGCLEGAYSAEFAKAGYQVTGIDVRQSNLARCPAVPRLRLVNADVRFLAQRGESYDAVFASGILYHLEDPVRFLRQVAPLTPLLILDTHVSADGGERHEGCDGHWYDEPGGLDDPWGAWVNGRSFWLTLPDLLRSVREAGYGLVLADPQARETDRVFLVAVR